jgi:hypothetical protein
MECPKRGDNRVAPSNSHIKLRNSLVPTSFGTDEQRS